MLFAVVSHGQSPPPIELDKWIRLAQKHTRYLEDLEKKGRVKFSAPFAGRIGRITILEVDSNDQLFSILNNDPLFRYTDREIIPLVTNKKVYENYDQLKKNLSKGQEE